MAEVAPGVLEVVRTFLNTWVIPNDTRAVVDRLPSLVDDPKRWAEAFPDLVQPDSLPALITIRAELRDALGQTHPVALAGALRRHPLLPALRSTGPAVELAPVREEAAGQLLAIALNAASAGQWHRLRACPDCRWVFYDTSRNGSRTWCAMTAGDASGRGCGSIAKTRAYRARRGSLSG